MGLEKLQAELFVLALNILADCMIFIAQDWPYMPTIVEGTDRH